MIISSVREQRGGIERKESSCQRKMNILGNEVSEVRGVSCQQCEGFLSVIGSEDVGQTIVGIRMSKHGQVKH